eukprot:tig00000204_g17763.t1
MSVSTSCRLGLAPAIALELGPLRHPFASQLKCQAVKRLASYNAADGNDAAQAKIVISKSLASTFDFQGHPSDFRAIDTNHDNFASQAELETFFAAQGLDSTQISKLVGLYDENNMSNSSELLSSEVRSQLSALAHVEPAKAELAVQYAAPGASAVADDDPARIGFLPAQPRLADGDRFRKDVRNYQSAQPTKYLFGPDAAGGQEYTKSEALAGVIVGRIRPGALRAVIERKRDLYEASIAGLERDRATLRRLELVPANLRSADDDATILALQQSCARDEASIVATRDAYLRAPGLLDTITAWIHKARPHAARRALTEPYTGEDPRSWHDWFLPLVRHTLPTGQRLAVYYAECLRTALEARATSEDPEYQNLDVRMAGFAKLNERTLREFLTALDQRILALDGALSPLQLDDLFLQACETHGCPPRVRKMAVAADDEDEPDEAVPTKSVHAAPGTKAPPGAPVLSRRHPDEENLGYPCTTTTPCPLCMHVEMPALDRCHFTWNCAWGTAPFPGIPYADWVKGIAEKRAGLKRRERATREDEGPDRDERGDPGPNRGGYAHRGGHRQEPYPRGGFQARGGFRGGARSGYAGGSGRGPASGPNQRPLGKGKETSEQDEQRGCWTCGSLDHMRRDCPSAQGNAQSGRGRGYGPEQNRGPRPRFNQVRAGGDPPRSEPPNPGAAHMAEFFQHLLVQSQQQALHEAARAASSSSAGSKPGPGAPSGDPSIKSVLVMPVGTETDMDLSVPVAAVRQPADASVIAARARDQAAFDAAASTLAAGALDDAARETEFEAALRFASPASDDGSGDSEIGETDADGLSVRSESDPLDPCGKGSGLEYVEKKPLSAPTGLRYMPGDHTESVLVDSQREGSRFIVRRIAPLLMPLSKWYALLASEPRALSRAVGLLFTNGMEGHKQIPLVRKLAGEGTIGIVADRFLGACGLNRADRLLLGRLTQRTEVNNLACVIETAAVVARTDHRLHEGPDSGRAMRAILRAAFAHPEDPGSCSGVGPPPDDSEVVWPDLAFEFDTASPRAWDDLLAAWEQHAPKSACWDLASEASWLSDSDRSPILSLLVASAYLLAQPGLQWPRILAENANGYDVAFDPRDWDETPDTPVSPALTGYHAMRSALAAAREILHEDCDFHAYCVQLLLAIIRFRTLTVVPGALGFGKNSLFEWITPHDVAPPVTQYQTYAARLREVAGAACFDKSSEGTVAARVLATQAERRARCVRGEPPLVNLSELVQHGSDLDKWRVVYVPERVAVQRMARLIDPRRPDEFSSLLFSDWLLGIGTYRAAPTVVVDRPVGPDEGLRFRHHPDADPLMRGPSIEAFLDRRYPVPRRDNHREVDVLDLLASRAVPRLGPPDLVKNERRSSPEFLWLMKALQGEMDSAARNGEFTWCVFVWVCYCMSQSGVYATTLLDQPAHRMRLVYGEVRRRYKGPHTNSSVWDKHNEIIASCDALARTVATTRRGRGKPTAAAAGTTEGRGRSGSRARRGAPARPPGDRAAASGSSDPGSGSSDEGEGGAATPPPDAMESDEHAGIDADARERMWHALFVRSGIDAKLFELVGCPAPSSNWSTSVEHMWLATSGLTQAQNPLLLQIEPHPELQGWLAAETAQPPWRRFSHFHADASREAWERLELSVPQRHPANVRFLRRAVASFELAAWNSGLLTPRPELPTEPDRWTCSHWDAVFLDRFEFHVSRLPGYYVNDRWRASQNTGPGLDVVEPVPAHARWLMSCWFSGRTGPGTVPFVPYSEQQLPEEVRFFYGRVRALHPGCEGLVCELASMYPRT